VSRPANTHQVACAGHGKAAADVRGILWGRVRARSILTGRRDSMPGEPTDHEGKYIIGRGGRKNSFGGAEGRTDRRSPASGPAKDAGSGGMPGLGQQALSVTSRGPILG
jgi:hypothetical protein